MPVENTIQTEESDCLHDHFEVCAVRINGKRKGDYQYIAEQYCTCQTHTRIICPFCDVVIHQPYQFGKHLYSKKHYRKRTISCSKCNDPRFQNQSNVMKVYIHALTHYDTTNYLKPCMLQSYSVPEDGKGAIIPGLRSPSSHRTRGQVENEEDADSECEDSDSDQGPGMGQSAISDEENHEESIGDSERMEIEEEIDSASEDSSEDEEDEVSQGDFVEFQSIGEVGDVVAVPPEQFPIQVANVLLDPGSQNTSANSSDQNAFSYSNLDPSLNRAIRDDPNVQFKFPKIYTSYEENEYFKSEEELKFIHKHYLHFGATVQHLNQIIKDLKDEWQSPLHVRAVLPNNYQEIYRAKCKLPVLKTKKHGNFSLFEQIQRNLSMDPEFLCKMKFFPESSEKVSEFIQTPRFKEIFDACRADELPLPILLYTDGFRKFRSVFGAATAIYYTFLNVPKMENAKLNNIFTLSLCKSEFRVYQTISDVLAEVLNKETVDIKLNSGKILKLRPFIAMDAGDMPQRHHNLHMLSFKSPKAVCFRCPITEEQIAGDIMLPPRDMMSWKEKLLYYINLKQFPADFIQNDINPRLKIKELEEEGVRLHANNQSGNAVLIPYPSYFDFPCYDPFLDKIEDLFHIELMGLFPKHFKQLQKAICGTDTKSLRNFGVKYGINIKGCKYWNGDQWIVFIMKSVFILDEFCKGNENHKKHLICWEKHVQCFMILVQEEMTASDVEKARQMCLDWRRRFVELYPHKTKLPNFHAILHAIDDIPRFGPPIIYWVRNFEHKHKQYRGIIDLSNFKNVEANAMEKEEMSRIINLMFPYLKQDIFVQSGAYQNLKKGDFVELRMGNGSIRIAQVIQPQLTAVTLKIFGAEVQTHERIQKAVKISTLTVAKTSLDLPYNAIVRKLLPIGDYLNPYVVLNYARFTIPKRITMQ